VETFSHVQPSTMSHPFNAQSKTVKMLYYSISNPVPVYSSYYRQTYNSIVPCNSKFRLAGSVIDAFCLRDCVFLYNIFPPRCSGIRKTTTWRCPSVGSLRIQPPASITFTHQLIHFMLCQRVNRRYFYKEKITSYLQITRIITLTYVMNVHTCV